MHDVMFGIVGRDEKLGRKLFSRVLRILLDI